MSAKVYLSLVFHNHQPVGNFDYVFQEAYEKSYLPLIEVLERHPAIRCGMHFTGCLRDWILENHPDLYQRARALVERGQLEILGGAYYEPILVMLSDEDKIGQIKMLSDAVEKDFGPRPQGMWLAERVWEPSLAKPIAQAGLRYTIVDNTHFNFTGFKDDLLYGYYVTEEQGYKLNVFPTSKEMRYIFPWHEVEEVMAYLKTLTEHQGGVPPLAFMGDDGEKFGLWPGTYQRCWVEGYMDHFFNEIEKSADWLATTTPSDYLRQFPALGRAYLPTASYVEMTEWAMPPERAYEISDLRHGLERELDLTKTSDPQRVAYLEKLLRNMRGGFWRNFLVKYPEVNQMQKRGMYTSTRIHALPDGEVKDKALSHLWASQCNCAYWHGVFGGIYLFHIRAANYANLLTAESLILDDKVHIEHIDFDLDSQDELIVAAMPFSLVFDMGRGGALIEWDDIPSRYNLLNIMTRRREGYHVDLEAAGKRGEIVTPDSPRWNAVESIHSTTVRAKEAGLDKMLIVDWYRHGSFIDHFFSDGANLDQFRHASYGEEGDFVSEPYEADVSGSGTNEAVLTLHRDGHVWVSGQQQPVRVEKRITVTAGVRELSAEYTVTNQSQKPLRLRFGVETSYGFDGGNTEWCYIKLPDGQVDNLSGIGESQQVKDYVLGTKIRGFDVNVQLAKGGWLWRFPLEPVTISEAGFERIHQGAVMLHGWTLDLKPGESWKNTLKFEVVDLKK